MYNELYMILTLAVGNPRGWYVAGKRTFPTSQERNGLYFSILYAHFCMCSKVQKQKAKNKTWKCKAILSQQEGGMDE